MHSVTDRRTDRRTDGQYAAANSRSYCVAVRSAKKYAKEYDLLFNADKSKCIISSPREVAHTANVVYDISYN